MKKLVLLDMDGTVYLGDRLIDGVLNVFSYFQEHNIKYVFLTNNSSHSIDFYEKKIKKMGINCGKENFYTSIETTIKYLNEHHYQNVFVLGVSSFKEELKKHVNLIEKYEKGRKIDLVLASFDIELTYEQLKDACLYLQDGCDFIATNMDYRCPIEDGYYIPDCGGLCKWIELCTGRTPIFLGKPSPEMIYQVMDIFGVSKEETILVGDRYYTDIKAGLNAGIDTLAVLTGETTLEEFESQKDKPTYIKNSLIDLISIINNE